MIRSFTCARCGATFVAAFGPNHHGPMPHTCATYAKDPTRYKTEPEGTR